jgi:DNA-binding IclR family transcriptional regulator
MTVEATTRVEPVDGVLARAFQVLNVVGARDRALTLAQISRETDLPKTTVHRVLQQMLRLGALERVGDRYRIGLHMFSLGSVVPEVQLRNVALPRLIELQRHTGHTMHLATMREDQVVYLEKFGGAIAADIPSSVGGTLSAHATGVGKAMLAYLPRQRVQRILREPLQRMTSKTITDPALLLLALERVRESGIAMDNEETVPGLSCVAHPILHMGVPVASVSISYPTRAGVERSAVSALRQTCVNISRDLSRLAWHANDERELA